MGAEPRTGVTRVGCSCARGPQRKAGTEDERRRRRTERFGPRVAVFSDGAAIVAWTSQDGETCGTRPCLQLYARPISAASVPGPTEEVSPPDQRLFRGTERLAVNTQGAALFAWQQVDEINPGAPTPAGSFTALGF